MSYENIFIPENPYFAMSLKDPDEDYEELVPEKKGFLGKALRKSKKYLIVLIIGIILGALLQVWLINPIMNSVQVDACKDCFNMKTLLNTEHECLYKLVPDPNKASEQCKTTENKVLSPAQS